jgi:hypothetical protein
VRFTIDFLRAFFILLRVLFPIWGSIAVLITLAGFALAKLEGLSMRDGLYFAWVTGTTVGYGDISPTTGPAQVLAISVAILGIVLTGITVSVALEAAKVAIQRNGSLDKMRETAEQRMDRRAGDRRRTKDE